MSTPQTGEGSSPAEAGVRVARLGPSLVIKGTLSGEEDLLVEGRVDGEISLRQNRVTVGENGRVKADIFSKSICVEGEVQGNLFGEDEVVIRRSGKVRGNVTAPRVTLENGAKFKGAIDMQPGSEKKPQPERKRQAPPAGAAAAKPRAAANVTKSAGGAA